MEKYKRLITKAQEPLSDAAYLDKYIEDMYRFKPDEIWAVKDPNSIIVGVSLICAQIHGFKNIEQGIGKTQYDIRCKVVEYADALINQDRYTEQIKQQVKTLDVHDYCGGPAAIQSIRYPIINPATNNTLGVLSHGKNLEMNIALKTILDLHGQKFDKSASIYLTNNKKQFDLTNIERDVLFCICLGINNRKDIANFLAMAYQQDFSAETTIHDAFRRLYRKLNCNTPMQLLEFAVYNDLNLQIPQAFLPTGSYIMR